MLRKRQKVIGNSRVILTDKRVIGKISLEINADRAKITIVRILKTSKEMKIVRRKRLRVTKMKSFKVINKSLKDTG